MKLDIVLFCLTAMAQVSGLDVLRALAHAVRWPRARSYTPVSTFHIQTHGP